MHRSLFVGVIFLASFLHAQQQANCSYKLWAPPAPWTDSGGAGINKYGTVVGVVADSNASYEGYRAGLILYSDGTYKTYNYGTSTWFSGRNDSGVTVGAYLDTSPYELAHGLILYQKTAQTVDYPGGSNTVLNGINNNGVIVGSYEDSAGNTRGFTLSGGKFQSVQVPNSQETWPSGISDSGIIVGYYYPAGSTAEKGFVLANGTYRSFSDPYGVDGTALAGINKYGTLVGQYVSSIYPLHAYAFRYKNGSFQNLVVPGSLYANAAGINVYGTITGGATFSGAGGRLFIAHCQ
jgi:hypothetical protein